MKVCEHPPFLFLSDTHIQTLVFNFWEPLHFLDRGYAFQTWELSPVFALRSWAYILLHLLPARIASILFGPDKVCIQSETTLPGPNVSHLP